MNVKNIPINDLKPYAHNPKTHPTEQVERISRSIEEFGFLVPVLIDADNSIIAGHGRLLAARKLGLEEIPTIGVEHLTEAQIRAYRIADNKLTESPWDIDLLESEIDILQDMDFDIDLTGFDDIEIGEMFPTDPEDFDAEAAMDDDSVPLVRAGELWILGDHRLLCGDSTKSEDVERLMGGEKVDLAISSPPYWNQRDYSFWSEFDEYMADMELVWRNLKENIRKGGILFWNVGDDSPNHRHISAHHSVVIEKLGYIYIDSIIWKKPGVTGIRLSHQKTHNKYYPGFCFEPLLVFQNGNGEFPTFDSNQKPVPLTNVWEISCETSLSDKHPAPFPINLAATAVSCYSKTNDVVIDLFGGSGTTLIACEQLNRRCYMMELDPHYCGVILDRWANYTKEDPIREDGMLWSELKESQQL